MVGADFRMPQPFLEPRPPGLAAESDFGVVRILPDPSADQVPDRRWVGTSLPTSRMNSSNPLSTPW